MMYKPYKILMVAMSMSYGGAETHILELSRFLSHNGVDIKVISNGGEYVKDLQDVGIEHISAPFHTRNLIDMLKAEKILKRIVKSFNPDAVHAHARIPALIASGVCRRLKVPLITTTHGTYKTSPLLKLATNWGDYNLYVSEDVKNYLIKNYKLKQGSMTKTINAVNTDLFSCPDSSLYDKVRHELGINSGEKIILTVSRLDKHSSFSAYKLIENAKSLYQAYAASRIIIVGTGTVFDDVKAKADKVNQDIGFEYITVTGGRTDVYRFCIACDIFVGISRAALEAMSCGKNIILCGDFGYLGRFSEVNSADAESTNFTCRSFGYPSDVNSTLQSDISFCLDEKNDTETLKSRKFGVQLVTEKYGVKTMADDAYSVYEKAVLKYKPCDFILTGYYGHDNIGDTALLFAILSNIAEKSHIKNYKICVLAKNPKKLKKYLGDYFTNVVAKSRFNIFHVRKSIKASKALVFGGGTLLQDNTSTRSLSYYLLLLRTAQKYGKKTILYANGIGPIHSEKNKSKVKEVMQNITLATIRDEDSYNILLNMGVDGSKIHLTTDEAVTLMKNRFLDAYKRDFKDYIGGDYAVISIRKWKSASAVFFAEFAAAIDIICRETKLIPVYIVMEEKNDKLLSERLASLSSKGYVVKSHGDIEKVLTVVRSATAVISMRLHALIFAAAFGVPMIGISYDPKVQSFLSSIFGSDDYTVDMVDFKKDDLIEKFRALVSHRDNAKMTLDSEIIELYGKAQNNIELFIREINS